MDDVTTNTILGPSIGYVDMLDEATTALLMQEKADGKEYQKSPLRPSASGSCTRELYYSLMQYSGRAKYDTEINTPTMHRIFSLGHSVEYHLLKHFDLLKNVLEQKYKQQVLSFRHIKATNDPRLTQWIEGSLDVVLWSEKYKCVADVKSKKDKWSAGYKSAWDELSDKLARMKTVAVITDNAYWVEDLEAFLAELNDPFFAANFYQLNLYANSDFLVERGVNHGAIIQYNKNDSRLREIRFKPSRKLYEQVLDKFATVVKAVDEDREELATRDHTLGNIKCAFCKFKAECWGGTDAKQAWFDTFPAKRWPANTKALGESGKALEKLFELYAQQSQVEDAKKTTEAAILKVMGDQRVNKIKLANGEVYEAKQYKYGLAIKRSKL